MRFAFAYAGGDCFVPPIWGGICSLIDALSSFAQSPQPLVCNPLIEGV
jgi:hypothetical protein